MVHIFLVTQRQGDLGHRNEDRLKPEATLARASPMPSGASRPGSAVAARAPVPSSPCSSPREAEGEHAAATASHEKRSAGLKFIET